MDISSKQCTAAFLGALIAASGLSPVTASVRINDTDRRIQTVALPSMEEIQSFQVRPFSEYANLYYPLNGSACFIDSGITPYPEWFECDGIDDGKIAKITTSYFLFEETPAPKGIIACCSNLLSKTYYWIKTRDSDESESQLDACGRASQPMAVAGLALAMEGKLSELSDLGHIPTFVCDTKEKCLPTGTLKQINKRSRAHRKKFGKILKDTKMSTCVYFPDKPKAGSCGFYHEVSGILFGAITQLKDPCDRVYRYLFPDKEVFLDKDLL